LPQGGLPGALKSGTLNINPNISPLADSRTLERERASRYYVAGQFAGAGSGSVPTKGDFPDRA
jgi:hypothetical protein